MVTLVEESPLVSYEQVWNKTQAMVASIIVGDWDNLMTLAAEREAFFDVLKQGGGVEKATLVPQEQARLAELMQAIQVENAKISGLVLQRMEELQSWLASGQRAKALERAYEVA